MEESDRQVMLGVLAKSAAEQRRLATLGARVLEILKRSTRVGFGGDALVRPPSIDDIRAAARSLGLLGEEKKP